MGDAFAFKMLQMLAHGMVIGFHIGHLRQTYLVQRYADAFGLFYQKLRPHPVHGYPVGSIVDGGDEVFDVDVRIIEAVVKREGTVFATTPVEY